MNTNVTRTGARNERGIAMLVAMIVLVLMAIIGLGFMFMADTENSVNNNYRDSQRSYFASRAGIENARVLLAAGALNTQVMAMDGKMPGSSSAAVVYVYNPTGSETIDPTTGDYADDELCQEQFATLNSTLGYTTVTPGVPCAAPGKSSYFSTATGLNVNSSNPAGSDIPYTQTASALPFKWVRITNKQNMMGLLNSANSSSTNYFVDPTQAGNLQVCFNGTNEFVISSGTCLGQKPQAEPVWLLTSMAITPRLGSRPGSKRVTQMELALSPPLLPPGVVSTEAPLNFHGSSVNVDAMDNCNCNPNKCTTTTSGLTTCQNRSGTGNCSSPYTGAYTAGTVSTNGNPTAETQYGNSLSTNNSASIQQVSPWPYNIDQLINSYASGAQAPSWMSSTACPGTPDFTAVPPVYAVCGTHSGGTYGQFPGMDSTGALNNSPPAIFQTTYIPGTVHLAGGPTGAGVLIVDGDLTIDSGFQFYGLVLVRGQVTFSGGGSAGTNIYGAILAGGDVSNKCQNSDDNLCTDSVGGNVNLQYDSCALSRSSGAVAPRLLATHEIQY